MKRSSALSALICTSISALFIYAELYRPFIALLLPLILIIAFSVQTAYSNILLTATSACIIEALSYFILKDLFCTAVTVPVMIAAGIVSGIIIKKHKKGCCVAVCTILSSGIIYVAYIVYSVMVFKVNPISEMFTAMTQVLEQSGLEISKNIIQEYIELCKNLYISVTIIAVAVTGYALAFFTSVFFDAINSKYKFNLGFAEFRADYATTAIYLIVLVASIFVKDDKFSIILLNLYMIMQFVMIICGLSLIYYFMTKRNRLPKILRVLLTGFLLLLGAGSVFSVIFTLAALFDARRDFRCLNNKEE